MKKFLSYSIAIILFLIMPIISLAEEDLYFEGPFERSNAAGELFIKICDPQTGGNCRAYDSEIEDYITVMNVYDIDYDRIEKFYRAGISTLEELKNYLKSIKCIENQNCYQYVKEDYCNNWNSTKAICQKLIKLEGQNVIGEDGEAIVPCHINLKSRGQDEIVIISSYYNKKEDSVSFSGVSGFDIYDEKIDLIGELNLNKNNFYFYAIDSDFATFKINYIKKLKESRVCPKVTFCLLNGAKSLTDGAYKWYAELDGQCDSQKYAGGIFQTVDEEGINSGLTASKETNYGANLISGGLLSIADCETLLGGEDSDLVKGIRTIIKIVKIIIPILLLVLGSIDFVQAIFSVDENDMKKAQIKFIKRVIIAVIIFLIPTILSTILEIANNVWGNIDTNFCGILDS